MTWLSASPIVVLGGFMFAPIAGPARRIADVTGPRHDVVEPVT